MPQQSDRLAVADTPGSDTTNLTIKVRGGVTRLPSIARRSASSARRTSPDAFSTTSSLISVRALRTGWLVSSLKCDTGIDALRIDWGVFNLFVSQEFGEYFPGGLIAENASRTFIQSISDSVEFVLRGSGREL